MNDLTKKSEQEFSSNSPDSFKLNRNQLKYIAILAMLLDHIGMVFGEFFNSFAAGPILLFILRFLGRLTAPIMCFFLVEGFLHTRSKKRYALRLAIFAVISQVPYALAHKHSILSTDFNMLFTLLISFLVLCVIESECNAVLHWLGCSLLIISSVFGDWGIFAPFLVLTFYFCHDNKQKLIKSYIIISVLVIVASVTFCVRNQYPWYSEFWQTGLLLFIPVLFLYNGQSGSRASFHKWFFYIFYPLHLLGLWGIWYFIQ